MLIEVVLDRVELIESIVDRGQPTNIRRLFDWGWFPTQWIHLFVQRAWDSIWSFYM